MARASAMAMLLAVAFTWGVLTQVRMSQSFLNVLSSRLRQSPRPSLTIRDMFGVNTEVDGNVYSHSCKEHCEWDFDACQFESEDKEEMAKCKQEYDACMEEC
mmetsp:Transcript_27089/g.50804  ORF Transcript_27089/g.50804 Transcript_27089/m.50804 type:complete len:102 (-) Transcript_27089:112-417(-)